MAKTRRRTPRLENSRPRRLSSDSSSLSRIQPRPSTSSGTTSNFQDNVQNDSEESVNSDLETSYEIDSEDIPELMENVNSRSPAKRKRYDSSSDESQTNRTIRIKGNFVNLDFLVNWKFPNIFGFRRTRRRHGWIKHKSQVRGQKRTLWSHRWKYYLRRMQNRSKRSHFPEYRFRNHLLPTLFPKNAEGSHWEKSNFSK